MGKTTLPFRPSLNICTPKFAHLRDEKFRVIQGNMEVAVKLEK